MNVKLVVVQGKPAGKTLTFGPGEYYLGRGPECQLRFNSDWVSRQHCLLRVGYTIASIRDLGSRNGTLVNGQLVSDERPLLNRDQVQIGPVTFVVELDQPPTPYTPLAGPPEVIRPADQDSAHTIQTAESTAHYPALPPRDGK